MTSIRLFEELLHAQLYAKYRPTYPKDLLNRICRFLRASGSPQHASAAEERYDLAVDVACGSGQSTFFLASKFRRCIGVDVSKRQVEFARKKAQEKGATRDVEFVVGSASQIPLEPAVADLVGCAQAWHWFEQPGSFYDEAKRVLKPGGVLAVYGYGNMILENKESNDLVSDFYWKTLHPYKHANRRHIDELYREVVLPFERTERHDFSMGVSMTLPQVIGYLSSSSYYQGFIKSNPESIALGRTTAKDE